METTRHIGVDLHRNCFTACVRLEDGRNYVTAWKLDPLPKFVAKLRPSDEVAVEVTGNTRLFYDAVAPHVKRIVAVNPNQFKVITLRNQILGQVQRQVAGIVGIGLLDRAHEG